jgi:hypothetical protein
LKSYFASPHFTYDEKQALRTKAFENDQSDSAKTCSKICDFSLPDAKLKERLWHEITDSASVDSLAEIKNKIAGFQQRRYQLDLIAPFFDKFYDTLVNIVDSRDREFAETFMNLLSPSFMAREQDATCFAKMLANAKQDKQFFVLFLKKQIEAIDLIQRSRKLCETLNK